MLWKTVQGRYAKKRASRRNMMEFATCMSCSGDGQAAERPSQAAEGALAKEAAALS